MKHVYEFFAVTANGSLCRVRSPSGGLPSVVKIGGAETPEAPLGRELNPGNMVSIGERIVTFKSQDGERDLSLVNMRLWRGATSPVIALFLNEDKARECLSRADAEPGDGRWAAETREVLVALGDGHRHFSVARAEGYALAIKPSPLPVCDI